jgi:hypothetical protein
MKKEQKKKREPIVFTPRELRYNRALFEGTLTKRNMPKTPGYTRSDK